MIKNPVKVLNIYLEEYKFKKKIRGLFENY